MAENRKRQPEKPEPADEMPRENPATHAEGRSRLGSWASPKLLAGLLACSVILNVAIPSFYRFQGRSSSPAGHSPEVSLGEYRYVGPGGGERGAVNAQFSLHIALLNGVEQMAREQLAARRHRVQQGVEELLRRAQSGDFDDPALGDLKRQLQERINSILELRAIAEVIVTDLVFHQTRLQDQQSEPLPNPAGTVWHSAFPVQSPWAYTSGENASANGREDFAPTKEMHPSVEQN